MASAPQLASSYVAYKAATTAEPAMVPEGMTMEEAIQSGLVHNPQGIYSQAVPSLQTATAARYAVNVAWARAFVLGPVGLATALPKVQAFLAEADPGLQGYQASIRKLHDQAQAAFKTAEQMVAQSKKALQSAGADPVMASRSLDMAKQGQVIVTNDRTSVPKFIQDVAATSGPSLPGILTQSFFGIPVWVWGAAGLLLALALTAGPTVVSVGAAQRRAA